ncbi:MBL fold metallo-hydrolase [Cyanobium sp. T1B-Tous]|uniref:MBL fold metallo-hydrolase n=1 Tax=Cyanobium sp. T1B-Tous TaxID=2823721 RepID=UPI0020CBFFF5|nr:MBL fold metallo-hydrolase [Cyanobium sp. T1B-Tous]MCP9806709.1 MBL fold metallo-hydrolase [Cyanobium sp. T1B-Tous]
MAQLSQPPESGRPPQLVRPGLWLFAPSRDSQGGSSWLLEAGAWGGRGDLLVDCPGFTQANLDSLQRRTAEVGPGTIVLTSREGHGRCRRIQEALGWSVLVQEQEAYLLPGVKSCTGFGAEHTLAPGVALLWTPGPTPGACVLHVHTGALDGLFCGRLLVPTGPSALAPLPTARTFHWGRQLASVERLRRWLPAGSPAWIASGAGLGALRGDKLVMGGAALLAGLDLASLAPAAR